MSKLLRYNYLAIWTLLIVSLPNFQCWSFEFPAITTFTLPKIKLPDFDWSRNKTNHFHYYVDSLDSAHRHSQSIERMTKPIRSTYLPKMNIHRSNIRPRHHHPFQRHGESLGFNNVYPPRPQLFDDEDLDDDSSSIASDIDENDTKRNRFFDKPQSTSNPYTSTLLNRPAPLLPPRNDARWPAPLTLARPAQTEENTSKEKTDLVKIKRYIKKLCRKVHSGSYTLLPHVFTLTCVISLGMAAILL